MFFTSRESFKFQDKTIVLMCNQCLARFLGLFLHMLLNPKTKRFHGFLYSNKKKKFQFDPCYTKIRKRARHKQSAWSFLQSLCYLITGEYLGGKHVLDKIILLHKQTFVHIFCKALCPLGDTDSHSCINSYLFDGVSTRVFHL